MKIINAKCPNCGASLDIPNKTEKITCKYCNQSLIVDDETIRIAGNVSVKGIETDDELLSSAHELLDMKEYLKAKKKFLEYSEKNPDDYQGWLGLLVCRTRNFTIKDNNILFKTDVDKYYSHFLRVAPEDVKKEYVDEIENYLHPEFKKQVEQVKGNIETTVKKVEPQKYKKYIKNIARVFLIIAGITGLINAEYIIGTLFLISGLLLLPQISDKLNISSKKSVTLSTIFAIAGAIMILLTTPTNLEGTWINSYENLIIEFKSGNDVTIHSNGNLAVGKYSSKYNGGTYIITITKTGSDKPEYTLKYNPSGETNKKLCTYINEKCINYFKDKE